MTLLLGFLFEQKWKFLAAIFTLAESENPWEREIGWGGWEGPRGRRWEAAGHVRWGQGCPLQKLVLENLSEGSEIPSSAFSFTGFPIYFCTFEVPYAKPGAVLPCVFTSLLTSIHFWKKKKKSKLWAIEYLNRRNIKNNPIQDWLRNGGVRSWLISL